MSQENPYKLLVYLESLSISVLIYCGVVLKFSTISIVVLWIFVIYPLSILIKRSVSNARKKGY
jgi:ABC-type multidrug transport system permease subunit